MKIVVSICLAVCLVLSAAPASFAEPHQVLQGTQVHLVLQTDISSKVARDGDQFTAVVAEPVFLGNQLLIPAGTRVNGVIGTVKTARFFSVFRGQAYLNLTFRNLEIESRLIPVQMSILSLQQPGTDGNAKGRKDVKVQEGQVVQAKHDIKGDLIGGAIGTGTGAIVGAVFGSITRGFGYGLAGSAVYIVSRKGKDVDLPAKTGIMVRFDNAVTLPTIIASTEPSGATSR